MSADRRADLQAGRSTGRRTSDRSDAIVSYGLTIAGGCLILGLLTPVACIVAGVFLGMFYLAMPAFPWFPESPRSEGHYLYVNKNIIEMCALFALAFLPTGRWAGLDALLQAAVRQPATAREQRVRRVIVLFAPGIAGRGAGVRGSG